MCQAGRKMCVLRGDTFLTHSLSPSLWKPVMERSPSTYCFEEKGVLSSAEGSWPLNKLAPVGLLSPLTYGLWVTCNLALNSVNLAFFLFTSAFLLWSWSLLNFNAAKCQVKSWCVRFELLFLSEISWSVVVASIPVTTATFPLPPYFCKPWIL